jgi:hypothetical protein
MATKPATTPATAPAAAPASAGSGAQIMQHLQTLNTKLDDISVIKAKLEELTKLLANLGAAVTNMEHKITTLDVSVKAVNAGVKRAPKAPADGTTTTNADGAAPAATSPTGEKFASNTLTWLGGLFKADAVGVKTKYFSETQLSTLAEQLTADAAYQKFDTDIAAAKTDKAKDDLRYKKAAAEFRKLWAIGKEDAALMKQLQDDWRDAKSKYEQNNRTPAKPDA